MVERQNRSQAREKHQGVRRREIYFKYLDYAEKYGTNDQCYRMWILAGINASCINDLKEILAKQAKGERIVQKRYVLTGKTSRDVVIDNLESRNIRKYHSKTFLRKNILQTWQEMRSLKENIDKDSIGITYSKLTASNFTSKSLFEKVKV